MCWHNLDAIVSFNKGKVWYNWIVLNSFYKINCQERDIQEETPTPEATSEIFFFRGCFRYEHHMDQSQCKVSLILWILSSFTS